MTSEATDAAFEELLEFIRVTRGFDFTGYKRPSLRRRFEKRLQALRIEHLPEYLAYVRDHPEEYPKLFDTILINVTSFFRDPAAWEYVQADVVPRILAARGDGDIRVWSTGCSTGEEAYTLAMVLAEAIGEEAFRHRVKIYATDVDNDALGSGRHAAYSAEQVEPVPEELRERYFERLDGGGGTCSAPTSAARSSSAGTTSCRIRRSRASTCCRRATRSCTSRRRPRSACCTASTSRSARPATSSSASPRC